MNINETDSGILKIAVFASHNGSDLQAIIDACRTGAIKATVCAVVSNNADSLALQRARNSGIDHFHVSVKKYVDDDTVNNEILKILDSHDIDMIFLAGYLKKIGVDVLRKYHNRIFNIHPALLPKYGGKGMYGMNVHHAVINTKDTISGITVHRVNEEYDEGEIVAQTTVTVAQNETAESLAEKILHREHTFIIEVINKIIDGSILLGN
ncbi:MAG: phosphoribosylglycinamide formyltransferase [Eubacteriales bacterium]|nr:phosphoribosylglycinamide formyltransferase [Eubacteriales bacterium]